jgi:hypothetical protein
MASLQYEISSFTILILVFVMFIILYSIFSASTISNHPNRYAVYAQSLSSSSQVLKHNQTTEQQQQQQQPRQEEIINYKKNVVKLVADIVRNRLHDAVRILEITSRQPAVQNVSFANNISKIHMGIPENLDVEKRKVAQEILSRDKDFGSIYFTLPNGNIYMGEPYSDQKQLPRLNFADRDWYKGVRSTNNTYTSSVFISASIHVPAIAIAVPVYGNNVGINNNNISITNNSPHTLAGYWVGILDLASVQENINELYLDRGERLIVVDHNGTSIVDSSSKIKYNSTINSASFSKTNSQQLKSFVHLQSFKDALKGTAGTKIEIANGVKLLSIHMPIEIGARNWAVILIR